MTITLERPRTAPLTTAGGGPAIVRLTGAMTDGSTRRP